MADVNVQQRSGPTFFAATAVLVLLGLGYVLSNRQEARHGLYRVMDERSMEGGLKQVDS